MSYKSAYLNTAKIKKLYKYVKKTKALVCHQHHKFEEPVLKTLVMYIKICTIRLL